MKIVVKKKQPAPQPVTVTLELDAKEAMIVRTIFGHITGYHNGPRGMTDRIYKELGILGVPCAVIDSELIHLPDRWANVREED